MPLKPWSKSLRSWQNRARLVVRSVGPDCLIEATPAAGKTTFALRVAHEQLESGQVERVVIVCPTDHLRAQWTQAAAEVGIQLDPDLHGGRCVEARDYVGAVVTYHQVARKPAAFAVAPSRRRTLVVLDEIHHAADGKEWGDGLREAFGLASYRLALSGTPFRSDDTPIPFVRYVGGVSRADFTYGYSEAIQDRVCRPMYFPSYEGDLVWRAGGRQRQATFIEHLRPVESRQRLKTALLTETWLGHVLEDAQRRLNALRSVDHSAAGGLVVAINQAHARKVAELLGRRLGRVVPVAISDDPASAQTIKRFAESADPWLVAVNMVSEGVDIPRLRVGVYATNVSTEMYFRQVVGRFVRRRLELGHPQQAWLYLPKDPVLVQYAQAIEAERRHVLPEDEEEAEAEDVQTSLPTGAERRTSSYQPISGIARADELFGVQEQPGGGEVGVDWARPGADRTVQIPLAEHKEQLRAIHNTLVGDVARKTKTEHRAVHLELLNRTGTKIDAATVDQLDRRIRLLERWRDQGRVG